MSIWQSVFLTTCNKPSSIFMQALHHSISMSGNKKIKLASKNRKVPSWYLEANLKAHSTYFENHDTVLSSQLFSNSMFGFGSQSAVATGQCVFVPSILGSRPGLVAILVYYPMNHLIIIFVSSGKIYENNSNAFLISGHILNWPYLLCVVKWKVQLCIHSFDLLLFLTF